MLLHQEIEHLDQMSEKHLLEDNKQFITSLSVSFVADAFVKV